MYDVHVSMYIQLYFLGLKDYIILYLNVKANC